MENITSEKLENSPGSKIECTYTSAEEFLYSDDWASTLDFIKTTYYKTNIRKTGNLKPKVKSIVSSINFTLEKLEETNSEIPSILVFDLMQEFKLIFDYMDNGENRAKVKIYILTYDEYQELIR